MEWRPCAANGWCESTCCQLRRAIIAGSCLLPLGVRFHKLECRFFVGLVEKCCRSCIDHGIAEISQSKMSFRSVWQQHRGRSCYLQPCFIFRGNERIRIPHLCRFILLAFQKACVTNTNGHQRVNVLTKNQSNTITVSTPVQKQSTMGGKNTFTGLKCVRTTFSSYCIHILYQLLLHPGHVSGPTYHWKTRVPTSELLT